eukprot:m.81571 g.81571  ORF g.81571 m.81571 type:complete len:229 (+) comp25435_c0_seq1:1277-1963(+)
MVKSKPNDPEDQKKEDAQNGYYAQVATSKFSDTIMDTTLGVCILNLCYIGVFQIGSNDGLTGLVSCGFFATLHTMNMLFHYFQSIKKPYLRVYFFMALGCLGCLQGTFYLTQLGTNSGFLMLVASSIAYPLSFIEYVSDSLFLVAAAVGVFLGSSCVLYVFNNMLYIVPHIESTNMYSEPRWLVNPMWELILQAINYVALFSVLMLNCQGHLETHYRMTRLESALKAK